MLLAALGLNIVILVPVSAGLLTGGMDDAFGPDTDARRILLCVYLSIMLMSVGLIGLHLVGHVWAVPMTLALFGVQIIYKAGTVIAVGLASPVVLTNVLVVAVQISAILIWLLARG